MISNPVKQNKDAKIIISFDDYSQGNMRLAQMLMDFDLKATFFIETYNYECKQQIMELNELGFAIGSHTRTHPADLKQLPLIQVKGELESSKKEIENITNKPCTVLAYPRGRHNEEIKQLVKAVGYTEARNTRVLNTEPEDPFSLDTTIHIYDGRKEYGGRTWVQMAKFYLDHVIKTGGTFHIWGHAKEMIRDNQIENLRSILLRIKNLK